MRLIVNWDGKSIVGARIAAARPLAARVLVGQSTEKALALVPRLFSLCGQAQGVAARLALQAAQGQTAGTEERENALRSVALEAAVEHLWRLLLDWPALLGGSARKSEFLFWRQRLLGVSDSLSAAKLGAELAAWLDREALPELGLATASAPGALLPWMNAGQWAQEAIDESFASRPRLAGQTAETGVLARQSGDAAVAKWREKGFGVTARIAARYADLRDLAKGLISPDRLAGWLDAAPFGENGGLARVETARGLLLHAVQAQHGIVQRYVIVAPTEWNFHPQGAFIGEIVGSPAPTRAQAETLARCLALALDPCVAFEVVVEEV